MALPVTGAAQGLVQNVSQKSGQPPALSTGWHNELVASDLLPRYAYLTLSGLVFSATSTAYAALTTAGTTTTGLTLFNPPGSGKNAIIIDVEVGFTPVTLATVAVTAVLGTAIQTSLPTFGTAFTPTNNLTTASTGSVCKGGYGSSTITNTPLGVRIVGNIGLTVLSTNGGANIGPALQKDEVAGAVVIPPGSLATVFGVGTVADATSMQTMTWVELPF